MKIKTIHESLVNGQREQMVRQIDKYGVLKFIDDYSFFLLAITNESIYNSFDFFKDAIRSYFRIKNK